MGVNGLEKIIEWRRRERREAVIEARKFVECIKKIFDKATAIMYGSYARGDFNEWSDIDLLIITREKLPTNPLKRLDLVMDCLKQTPVIEPLIIDIEEFKSMIKKKNPIAEEILNTSIVIVDDLRLCGKILNCKHISQS